MAPASWAAALVALILTFGPVSGAHEFAGQEFDYVLTVCDNAKESCPVFFGNATRLHHNFTDPVRDALRSYAPSNLTRLMPVGKWKK